jgi:hypothetical protein
MSPAISPMMSPIISFSNYAPVMMATSHSSYVSVANSSNSSGRLSSSSMKLFPGSSGSGIASRTSSPGRRRRKSTMASAAVRRRAASLAVPATKFIEESEYSDSYSSGEIYQSSPIEGIEEKDVKRRRRRHGLKKKSRRNWFNYQNIVAMPVPTEFDEGETGARSTKTKVDSWWSADEYKLLSKKIQVSSKETGRVIPAEKKYQPRPYKVCFIDFDLNVVYNSG